MKTILHVICFLLIPTMSLAQLKADFATSDGKTGGCSPYIVSFKNLTQNASPSAIYHWSLGDNNYSKNFEPGCTYIDEKAYTVTLTVTDNGVTSTKSLIITVYQKPTASFSVDITKGCIPFTVNYKSTSTTNDGNIQNRFWDFGDGYTSAVNKIDSVSHTYSIAQNLSVRLVVTNSYGCQNSIQKLKIIEAIAPLNSAFAADKTILCKIADSVKFTQTNGSASAVNYLWDFGDGTTSTKNIPIHKYAAKGTYDVKLTVNINAAVGCKSSTIKATYINVGNFHSDFNSVTPVCTNTAINFNNASLPSPSSSVWLSSDDNYRSSFANNNFNKIFSTSGDYLVRLVNSFGACKDSVEKKVTVLASPVLQGFVISDNTICGAPYTATFKDTCKTSSKWKWVFDSTDNLATANIKSPSYTFTKNGNYNILLSVTDNSGCIASASKMLAIQKPSVSIVVVNSSSSFQTKGCAGLTIKFAVNNPSIITSYQWNFDDGTSSTLAQPIHQFTDIKDYNISLNYTTTQGCTENIVFENKISVNKKPTALFTSSSNTVCGNYKVTFTNQSTPKTDSWYWDFGDNTTSSLASNNSIVTHQYSDSGTYSVMLYAYNGGCGDTSIQNKLIHVLPPFNKINSAANTCNGNRNTVSFMQTVKYGNEVVWDFGDGTSQQVSTTQTQIDHDYKKSGSYTVHTISSFGECDANDSMNVLVLLKQNPVLTINKTEICANDSIKIKLNNLLVNPAQATNGYSITKWQYGDNSDFTGNIFSATVNWTDTYTAGLTNFKGGKKNVNAIIKSAYFGCSDTAAWVPLQINGPAADFTIGNNSACYKTVLNFIDTSSINNTINIQNRLWYFGDDSTAITSVSNSVNHTYQYPGNYSVSLKVIDDKGCFAVSSQKTTAVVLGTKTSFSVAPYPIKPGVPINFVNTSNVYNPSTVQYLWKFSNSNHIDSSANNVVFKYNNISADTVTLVATDTASKCVDSAVRFIAIDKMSIPFKYTATYIDNKNCPPLVLYAVSTPINADSVRWDFGDGSIAGNIINPSHTYGKPGVYAIKEYGFINGIIDSTIDYITIKGPYAIIKSTAYQKCTPANISLSATIINAVSYAWDFSDGTLNLSGDTLVSHTYTKPGIYNPSMVLKDSAGCISASNLPKTILMDSLSASIHADANIVCDATKINFSSNFYNIGSDAMQKNLQYKWFFGDNENSSSIDQNPEFQYSKPGKYLVTFIAQSDAGCMVQLTDSILVNPLPEIEAGPDKFILHGSSDMLNAVSTDSSLSYVWSPADYLNMDTILNPIITPITCQKYTLTATSKAGCSKSDTVHVTVLTQINVPNIFSPNGDGVNDTWEIKFLDSYPGATVDVFNRYGQKIYHSNGYPVEWDGKLHGTALPIGTYYYVIDPKNNRPIISGGITIIR